MVKPCGAQKVRDCLTYFVNLYNSVEVDDEGYIRFADGEMVYRQHRGRNTPVLVFQDPLPKERFFLLNPFAGAIRTDPAVKWFLNMMRYGVATTIAITLRDAVGIALVNRKIDIGTDHLNEFLDNDAYLNVLSGKTNNKKSIATEIDAQTYKEFSALLNSPDVLGNLVEFHYKGATLTTDFTSPLLSEGETFFEGKETSRQIRPKTRRVFIKAFENILGVTKASELSKFRGEARDDEATRIGSWLRCQFKVLRAIMPIVEYVAPHRMVDLDAYDLWLEQLPSITARAKTTVDSYFEAPTKSQSPMTNNPQGYAQQSSQPQQPQPMAQQPQPAFTPTPQGGPTQSIYGGAPLPTPANVPVTPPPAPMTGFTGQQPNLPQVYTGTQQSSGQFSFASNQPSWNMQPQQPQPMAQQPSPWNSQPAPMGTNYTPSMFNTPGTFRYG